MRMRLEWLADLAWPHPSGDPIKSPTARSIGVVTDDAVVDTVAGVLEKRLEQVDERNRTIDGKLVALFAVGPVLAAGITAAIAAAAEAKLPDLPRVLVWLLYALVGYALLQLTCCLRATVRGLTTRGFCQLGETDVDPGRNESVAAYRLRIVNLHRNALWFNEWQLNNKVDDLNVALESIRNIVRAVLCAIAVGLVLSALRLLGVGANDLLRPEGHGYWSSLGSAMRAIGSLFAAVLRAVGISR